MRLRRGADMAAMKPRTGDGPMECPKEGRGYVLRIPLETGERFVLELKADEVIALEAVVKAAAKVAAKNSDGEVRSGTRQVPRGSDGPLECVLEGTCFALRIPAEGGGRGGVELGSAEVKDMASVLSASVAGMPKK